MNQGVVLTRSLEFLNGTILPVDDTKSGTLTLQFADSSTKALELDLSILSPEVKQFFEFRLKIGPHAQKPPRNAHPVQDYIDFLFGSRYLITTAEKTQLINQPHGNEAAAYAILEQSACTPEQLMSRILTKNIGSGPSLSHNDIIAYEMILLFGTYLDTMIDPEKEGIISGKPEITNEENNAYIQGLLQESVEAVRLFFENEGVQSYIETLHGQKTLQQVERSLDAFLTFYKDTFVVRDSIDERHRKSTPYTFQNLEDFRKMFGGVIQIMSALKLNPANILATQNAIKP